MGLNREHNGDRAGDEDMKTTVYRLNDAHYCCYYSQYLRSLPLKFIVIVQQLSLPVYIIKDFLTDNHFTFMPGCFCVTSLCGANAFTF